MLIVAEATTPGWLMAANLLSPVILAVIGFLVKRMIGDVDRRVQAIEEANNERAAKELAHAEEHRMIERDFVGKEDWLRESGLARQRQEKILEEVQELKGKQEMGVQIASAIAAALNREHGGRGNG